MYDISFLLLILPEYQRHEIHDYDMPNYQAFSQITLQLAPIIYERYSLNTYIDNNLVDVIRFVSCITIAWVVSNVYPVSIVYGRHYHTRTKQPITGNILEKG